ncbi:polysaccharide biosynthesis/export family protein [Sphingomonas paucimobilis]|uniref:polysaccharide biosynthesis/export family protein n=1 Tax=Sphingomonas paucimobilis TaxID=13689 RepID=UPI00064C10E3|nr:polysaccharide biosynthesis/export family protein [Sphingomonas paucimobilis]
MNVGKTRPERMAQRLALALMLALGGCGGNHPPVGGATGLSVVPASEFPSPTVSDLVPDPQPYRIGPLDTLVVDVFGNEDLKAREIQVDASGRISFPLIGTVEVAGKTPREVETDMTALLRRQYIRDPRVTVNLKEIVSQNFTVGGEVTEPGVYPVIGEMTLLRAIARAKGLTEFSKRREVIIFRTVGQRKYAALYDVGAIERGVYPDPQVFSNDVVMVGDSKSRRIFRDVLTASPLVAPVFLLLN